MGGIRTLVVEDHEITRFGLVTLLNREPDIQVVAEAADGHTALVRLATTPCDLVVLDLTLPDMEGLQLIKLIRSRSPATPILVSSMHEELRYGARALNAGARGYVMKSVTPKILIEAVRCVAQGGTYRSEELRVQMDGREQQPERRPDHAALTDRELAVLDLLGHGHSSSEIAQRTNRSVKTIDAHRENIKKKLGLRNANELLRYAVCWVEEETQLRGQSFGTDAASKSKASPTGPTLPLDLDTTH